MKIVLFSDLHAHLWPEFAGVDKPGRHTRLMDCVSVIDDIGTYCQREGIEHVIFGGDLFHVPGKVHTETLTAVAQALERLQMQGVTVLAVDGNHDHARKDGSIHALQALDSGSLLRGPITDGWTYVDSPSVPLIHLFSYCDDRDVFMRRLDAAQKSLAGRSAIAVFHHGFEGAVLSEITEYRVKNAIDPTVLRGCYDFVFSGHYHARQKIQGLDNAWYIGSPLEHTRSDRGIVKKGFLVYDADTRELRIVPLRRPRFLKVDITTEGVNDPLYLLSGYMRDLRGNFLDVYWDEWTGGEEPLLECLREHKPRGINLHRQRQVSGSVKPRLALAPALSEASTIDAYINHRESDLKADDLDPVEIAALGKDLLSRAL